MSVITGNRSMLPDQQWQPQEMVGRLSPATELKRGEEATM